MHKIIQRTRNERHRQHGKYHKKKARNIMWCGVREHMIGYGPGQNQVPYDKYAVYDNGGDVSHGVFTKE